MTKCIGEVDRIYIYILYLNIKIMQFDDWSNIKSKEKCKALSMINEIWRREICFTKLACNKPTAIVVL